VPQFTTQFVGGPACGTVVMETMPPRDGDQKQWRTDGWIHLYVFTKWAHLPPQFRHQGIIGKPHKDLADLFVRVIGLESEDCPGA
jgi:hypothetical protein